MLHPLDFLSAEDAPELKFFPAMNLKLKTKLEMMDEFLSQFAKNFRVVNMQTYASEFSSRNAKAAIRSKQIAA